MSSFGQVYVENGKYRIKGDFHHLTPNQPIRDKNDNWRLLGVTNPRDMTYLHSYGGEAPFFESLSQGKLLGTRCVNPDCRYTGTISIPFRIHCPDCLGRNKIEDYTKLAQETGKIHTFMVGERSGAFNILNKPIKFINIEFDGVPTILMSYLAVGDPKIGMRVVPAFQKLDPTFTILDLTWVPEGTPASKLPKGFSL